MYVIEAMSDAKLRDSISTYVAHLTTKGRKQSTIKRYLYDLNDFFLWVSHQKPLTSSIWQQLTEQDYRRYFFALQQERNYSEKTIHRMSVSLHKYMSYLVEIGILSTLPVVANTIISSPPRDLKEEDFITSEEKTRLLSVVSTLEGLSEKQQLVRPLLLERNVSIFILLMDYGITLQELLSLKMNHINFHKSQLTIPPVSGLSRILSLKKEDKEHLYQYIQTIPEPVRPRYHSHDPLFVAFDFNRGTFRWVYEEDGPKALTEIAAQKMIRQEVHRAGIRKGVSAQHFRNTFILNLLRQHTSLVEIMKYCGLKARLTLKRYEDYLHLESITNKKGE